MILGDFWDKIDLYLNFYKANALIRGGVRVENKILVRGDYP